MCNCAPMRRLCTWSKRGNLKCSCGIDREQCISLALQFICRHQQRPLEPSRRSSVLSLSSNQLRSECTEWDHQDVEILSFGNSNVPFSRSLSLRLLIKTDLFLLYFYDHMQGSTAQKGWKEVIPNVVAFPWYIDTITMEDYRFPYFTTSVYYRDMFIASPLRRPLADERGGAGGRTTKSEWERSGVPDRVIGSSSDWSKDHSGD